MKVLVLSCLLLAAVSVSPCGAAPPGNSSAESTTPPSAADLLRITQVGLLCPTGSEAARELYNSALDLQHQGKLQEAREAYQKSIELDPQYCDAMDNLGQLLRSGGDIQEAISWYRRSLQLKPDNAVARQNLANAYDVQGEREKALAQYQWLAANTPDNPEGYYGVGKVLLELGRAKDAIGALPRACELYRQSASPLLSDAYYLLGLAYFTDEQCQKANEYLELSYPGREKDPNINYMIGLCYWHPSNQNPGKAALYLGKAQQLGAKIPPEIQQILTR